MKTPLLANILESMGDAFVALDTEWRYTYMNRKAGQIFNRRPEDMIGKHIWTEFPEGIGQPFYKAYYRAVETQTPLYLEEYYPPYDRWFENRIYPSPDGLAIFFQDITERKRDELLLTLEAQIFEVISVGSTLAEVLEKIVLSIEAISEKTIASVLLLDPDGLHVHYGAAPHLPEAYNRALEGAAIGPAEGSCGTAAYRREPVIVADIETDPLWNNYRELALAHGLRACWSTPIINREGNVVGTFAMYYREPRAPQEQDFRLIARATHLANIAIERKRAEEQLRESEARLTRIVETVPDGIVIVNREGQITFANAAAESILGLRRSDITNRAYDDPGWRITALDGSPFPQEELPFARVRQSGQPAYGVEHAVEHPDGQNVMLSINAAPLLEADGEFGGMVAAISDITERKRAEAELRESERRFREMLENVQLVAALLDLEGRVTFCNEFLLQITGYTRDEVLGGDWFAQFVPDARAEVKETFVRGLQRGEISAHYENPIRTKSGRERLIRFSNTLLRDAQGNIVGTTSLGEDITERKQAEEALRKSEETFSVIFNKAPFAAALAGLPDGAYVEVNEEFERMFGYTRQELVGKTSLELGMYPDPEVRARSAAMFREQGFVRNLDMRLQTRTGEIHDVLINSDLVEIGGEKYILTTANDITERRQAEEELRRNEHVLRLFVKHSPAAIAMFDRDMKYIVASRRYLSDYDLGEQEVVGRSHYEIFPEIPERWKEIHRRCLAGAIEKADEDPFPRISGKLDWIRWEIRPWHERAGEIGGIILFSEVITERKRAEESLRYSELLLREVGELAKIGGWEFDPATGNGTWTEEVARIHDLDPDDKTGMELGMSFYHGESRSKIERAVKEAIELGKPYDLELEMVTAKGTHKWVHTIGYPTVENGKIMHVRGSFQDITERKRAEAERERLHRQIQRRLAELNIIHRSAQQLQQLYTPEALAREIIRILEETLSYTFGAVLMIDDASGELTPFALSDQGLGPDFIEADKDYVASHGIRLGAGVTGWVAQTGQSLRLGDVRQDSRYYALRADIHSELCVPLRVGDHVIGVANVESTQPDAYTESDQRLLETVAAQIAVAIQNARLLEEARTGRERLQLLSQQLLAAQETERRHIARELHDEVGQAFTALKLNLQSLERAPAAAGLGPPIHESLGIVEHAIQQVRNLSVELRPSLLDDLGLIPALRWHLDRYTQRAGTAVHFTADPATGRPPPEIETVCFRVTQEALTNVMRHAQARQVWVDLRQSSDELRLTIRDDGRGFDARAARERAARGGSFGLLGMEERVLLIGGKIEIDSGPGQGTEIRVSFSLTGPL
jgi:PAS domain S-box-containing protein